MLKEMTHNAAASVSWLERDADVIILIFITKEYELHFYHLVLYFKYINKL